MIFYLKKFQILLFSGIQLTLPNMQKNRKFSLRSLHKHDQKSIENKQIIHIFYGHAFMFTVFGPPKVFTVLTEHPIPKIVGAGRGLNSTNEMFRNIFDFGMKFFKLISAICVFSLFIIICFYIQKKYNLNSRTQNFS